MNNNYLSTQNLYLQMVADCEKKRKEPDSDSSDSEFSDGFDGRLDEEFNQIIKKRKMDSKCNVVKQQIVNGPHHHNASPSADREVTSNEHRNQTAADGNANASDDSKPMVEQVNGQAIDVNGQAIDDSRPRATYESVKLFYENNCCSVQ